MSSAILIVDDETTWARNVTRYLQRHGFSALAAASLAEAEATLARERPALLCLDLRLPDGDGMRLLAHLRAAGDDTPCLLITGHASPEIQAQASTLGAGVIEKPVPLTDLRARITGLLGGSTSPTDDPPPGAGHGGGGASRPRSILMYSHDGYGLGHMRRNLNLAQRLRAHLPDVNVLMLVGCPSGLFFDLPPGVDFIKLPSIVKVDTGRWTSSNLSLAFETTCALRAGLILRTAQLLQPDLLLVDFLAQGVGGELLPTLDWLRSCGRPVRTVLGLRDILDRPERVKASWAKEGTLELIERWYDRVLIYGHRCLFDTAAAYGLSPRLDDRLVHCGYVAPAGAPRAGAGAAWPAAGRRRLLVTAGGGRDGEAILTTSLRALRLLPDVDRPATVLVAGPLMEAQRRADLERLSHGLPVEILRWTSDGRALAAEADLIVCMAGYNTLTECLSLGKRPIVVPRAGPSQEQRLRTELFAGLGLVRPVYPEELTPARMAEALQAALAGDGAARQGELVPLDGGDRAAMELVRLLGPEPTTEADAPLRRAAMGRR